MAATSGARGGGSDKGINVYQLPLEQLNGLKEQFDNDLRSLGAAFDALHGGYARYNGNVETLSNYERLIESSTKVEGKVEAEEEILVCMTSSLFVRGHVIPTPKVLIDVGTGYYLEEGIPQAKKYFTARAAQVKESMGNVEQSIVVKQQQQNQVIDAIQQKTAALAKYQDEK